MEMYQCFFVSWVSLFSSLLIQFNNDVKFINQFSPELSSSTEDDSVVVQFNECWCCRCLTGCSITCGCSWRNKASDSCPFAWRNGTGFLGLLFWTVWRRASSTAAKPSSSWPSATWTAAPSSWLSSWLTRGFWRRTRTWLCCCCWSPCCSTHTFCGCADGSVGPAFSSGRIPRQPRPGSGSRCATPYEWTTRPFTATSTADISPLSRRNWRSISCFELWKLSYGKLIPC